MAGAAGARDHTRLPQAEEPVLPHGGEGVEAAGGVAERRVEGDRADPRPVRLAPEEDRLVGHAAAGEARKEHGQRTSMRKGPVGEGDMGEKKIRS